MNTPLIVEDLILSLQRRYGKATPIGKSRLLRFGSAMTCSINYSKELRGNRYFFGLAHDVVDLRFVFPATRLGDFVLLVCGSADNVLVVPRTIILEMMAGVTTRRLDVFREDGTYILQTTAHPKLDVTEYLNAFPRLESSDSDPADDDVISASADRTHVRIQWSLIQLGRAEGCNVWVPPNDRSLTFRGKAFARSTAARLPNFGFEENTRRIIQNIDVLWLRQNVIAKAFEIEATTMIYSGLLRLNDLVLSQPNNQIDLYVVAAMARRDRVYAQLTRPSFRQLLPRCQFVTFELVEEQVKRLDALAIDDGTRVTGLIRGERFALSEHYVYPTTLR